MNISNNELTQSNPSVLANTLLHIGTLTPELRDKFGFHYKVRPSSLTVEACHEALYEAYLEIKQTMLAEEQCPEERAYISNNRIYDELLEMMEAEEIPHYSKVTFYSVLKRFNKPAREELYLQAKALVDGFAPLPSDERMEAVYNELLPKMDAGDLDYVRFSGFKKIIKEFGEAPFLKKYVEEQTVEFMRYSDKESEAEDEHGSIVSIVNQRRMAEALRVYGEIKGEMSLEASNDQDARRITDNRVFKRMSQMMRTGDCPVIHKTGFYRMLAEQRRKDAIHVTKAYRRVEKHLSDKDERVDVATVYKCLRREMSRGHLPFYSFRRVLKMVSNSSEV